MPILHGERRTKKVASVATLPCMTLRKKMEERSIGGGKVGREEKSSVKEEETKGTMGALHYRPRRR